MLDEVLVGVLVEAIRILKAEKNPEVKKHIQLMREEINELLELGQSITAHWRGT